MSVPTAPITRIAQRLALLWAHAAETLALMRMAFGGPQDVFNLCRPSRKIVRELKAWLAPLEALVRKLLLLEARKLGTAWTAGASPARRRENKTIAREGAGAPFPLTPRFTFPKPRGARDPRLCKGFGPRIMLILTRSPDYRDPNSETWIPKRKRFSPGVRYGLRYAALLAVLENPLRYAKRLARQLVKKPDTPRAIIHAQAPRGNFLDALIYQADLLLAHAPNTS